MPSGRPRRQGEPSFRAKQLIVLASDVVCETVRGDGQPPAAVADGLVADGTLPCCYHHRYDEDFLTVFHNVVELTRNALVSELPHVSATAGALAALAIVREARATLTAGGVGRERLAVEIDPELPGHLVADRRRLAAELTTLEGVALEDIDVLALFTLLAGTDPACHLDGRLGDSERALLRFENWLVPFGNPPRPRITRSGRVLPG